MKNSEANILIIFGATGDLTSRKIFPALNEIFENKNLPDNFHLVGCGRREIEGDLFYKLHKKISSSCKYIKLNPEVEGDYKSLNILIHEFYKIYSKINVVFYLSTPPSAYKPVISNLIINNLNNEDKGFRRVIVEKPFGKDLISARDLNKLLKSGFNEDQIYRIDHYLGKETVQNILVSRFTNLIFSALWNREFISYVEITAAESIGIENRGEYYDKSGAIRDMFQNHLLELLCLVAMDEPENNSPESIRDEKIKILNQIRKINHQTDIVRGQYLASKSKNQIFKNYTDNDGVKKNSKTETFFACKLFIENKRWKDIPFFIRTGKRLPTKVTEIVVNFKKNSNVFSESSEN